MPNRWTNSAIGPVIGSRSLNATRNGLSPVASCRQAVRLAADAGLPGVAGTRSGIARTAAAWDGPASTCYDNPADPLRIFVNSFLTVTRNVSWLLAIVAFPRPSFTTHDVGKR